MTPRRPAGSRPIPAGTRPVEDTDVEDTDVEDVELDDDTEPLRPACEGGISGWCGQLHRHARCYFNDPTGIAAVRAGTYGRFRGHQWVCSCPCHDVHAYPPCPHPDHVTPQARDSHPLDHDIQGMLF